MLISFLEVNERFTFTIQASELIRWNGSNRQKLSYSIEVS